MFNDYELEQAKNTLKNFGINAHYRNIKGKQLIILHKDDDETEKIMKNLFPFAKKTNGNLKRPRYRLF